MNSIGMIETYGYIAAVEAADAALKAADVKLIDRQFVKGGLVAITLIGDVAAVKASVDAGAAAGGKVGKIISTHVIARPDSGIKAFYKKELSSDNKCKTSKPEVSKKKHVIKPRRKKLKKLDE
jgi:microcompartment protein CcmL/EutN